jgi:hypothetical protein
MEGMGEINYLFKITKLVKRVELGVWLQTQSENKTGQLHRPERREGRMTT